MLASGSKGNACLIESSGGPGILIDCGICKRDLLAGFAAVGFDAARLTDILITHDHSDHTKCLGVCVRALAKGGVHPTLHASRAVRAASPHIEEALEVDGIRFGELACGQALSVGGGQMSVTPFPTSHDAAESFGFRIEGVTGDGFSTIGYMTDTGCVTEAAHEALQYVDALALEANHDPQMLREGPYPYALKRRIASDLGHLSNAQAAEELGALLDSLGGGMLQAVVAMHVSQENNMYSLAEAALADAISSREHHARSYVARQRTPISV